MSLLNVSCKKSTLTDKFMEEQSNPKNYGKAEVFELTSKIEVDLNKSLPKNDLGIENMKMAIEEGDK